MKEVLLVLIATASALVASPIGDFIARAASSHGASGERAARFLVEHMPEEDREKADAAHLTANLDAAFAARKEFPWASAVPEELFLNDVLPYAVFDETREAWRTDFMDKARGVVKGAKTASEAAQALNRDFFKLIKVHYHTGRKAPNQSPSESISSGRATCTGLSILLVYACRSVGIPARAVGTPMWTSQRGNHTWVEIWDGGWHFTGADEYDANGLDRGWFVEDAARADGGNPAHAIYATSWKREGLFFPLVWSPDSKRVAAVNVTSRYAKAARPAEASLGIRFSDGKERVATSFHAVDESGRHHLHGVTRSGTADLNDMPRYKAAPGAKGYVYFITDSAVLEAPFGPLGPDEKTLDASPASLRPSPPALAALIRWLEKDEASRKASHADLSEPLSREEAVRAKALLTADAIGRRRDATREELDARALVLEGKTLRWLEKTFGEAPADGRSLWISMHGGGGAPAPVNDQQWRNQIRLYQPKEGIYLAPRAPTDTWNLWHEGHIDPMFQRLIEIFVIHRGVNPDKVHLMGYSAGGDGVWQLAPRMADRFASAAMMAGHPNEASLDNLRNLPFAIFMGGNDAAYDRNRIAREKADELDKLAAADPGAYIHMARIYPGLGHWMNLKDAEAVPWMAGFRRQTWPAKIIWKQDDITHDRFYWLKIPDRTQAKAGQRITARVDGRRILIDGDVPLGTEVRLSDELLDLDQEIQWEIHGRTLTPGRVFRTAESIRRTLEERLDPAAAASAVYVVR